MTLTFENAKFADGKKLVEWLTRHELLFDGIWADHPNHASLLHKWAKGRMAHFPAVDALLTYLGVHVSELPDDIWVKKAGNTIPRSGIRKRALTDGIPRRKRCPGCGVTRSHTDWGRNRSKRDGLASYCAFCRKGRTAL